MWRDEAAAVERALELLRELPDTEAGEWSAWAWERIDDEPAAAARTVSHDVEKLRRSLRRFVAEHELERRCITPRANASALGDEVQPKTPDGCGLYPGADTD